MKARPAGTDEAENSASALPVGQNENGKIGADDRVLYPVLKSDLRAADFASLTNQTRLAPDVQTLSQSTPSALQNLTLDGSPLVLIVHTHGSEGYNECETDGYYDASLAVRSEDVTKNVVSVGTSLAEVLNAFAAWPHCRIPPCATRIRLYAPIKPRPALCPLVFGAISLHPLCHRPAPRCDHRIGRHLHRAHLFVCRGGYCPAHARCGNQRCRRRPSALER